MERNSHYLIVGIFVTAVLAIALVLFFWMSRNYDTNVYNRYSIYFEGSVGGLSEGSRVSYLGVNVGNVVSIRFDAEDPERIKTIVEIEEGTPISTSSQASIKSIGITGLSALTIKTNGSKGKTIPILKGEKYPIIASKRSELNQLLEDAPQITDNAVYILSQISVLLSNQNVESLGNTLDNLEELSQNINMFISEENVNNISATLQKLNKTASRLDGILSQNQKQIEHFTGDNLDEMAILIKESQQMVNAFKGLANKLSEDPSQILYKPNHKGMKVQQ